VIVVAVTDEVSAPLRPNVPPVDAVHRPKYVAAVVPAVVNDTDVLFTFDPDAAAEKVIACRA
jgi:hypothetical protein